MAHPFVEPCSRGVIDAKPCLRELGREAPTFRWVHGARRLRARVIDGVHRWDAAARCVTEIAR